MSLHKAAGALAFVPSHDRELWVFMGMSVKSEFGEEGFATWDAWSQGAESYNEKSARAVWRSIKSAGKIGIGSLFHEAAANGWRDDGSHKELTAQEVEAKLVARAGREAATIAEEARKQRGYRDAAAASQKIIDTCKTETHYYLNSKGLPEALGLVTDGALIIPMRNLETNKLQGIQTVTWIADDRRWAKKMAHGMRAKGAVLRLAACRT